jgi:type IV pilus assembly protein PilA
MVHKNEKGFTLIELLVVIAIIGILAAIAIPQFAAYRNQAFCSRVESDVGNAMIAAEGYYAQDPTNGYPQAVGDVASTFVPTSTVDITFGGTGGAGDPFTVTGNDNSGNCPKTGSFKWAQGTAAVWG